MHPASAGKRKSKKPEKTEICGCLRGLPVRVAAAGKVQNKMGKGNRARIQRAVDVLEAPSSAAKKSEKKTKRIIAISTAAVALVLAFFIVITVVFSTGLLNKMNKAVKSEHIDVNGTLMTYFYATEYQSLMQYAQYYGIDTSRPLHEQKIGDGDTTYADYLMSTVSSEVEQLVVLYNEAVERGMKLTDEEKADIDSTVETIEASAKSAGYSTAGYLAAIYGNGMNVKTLRQALEIQTLASDCYNKITEEIKAGVNEEKINKYYDEHEKDFLTADTVQYILTAELDTGDNSEATDAQKEEYAKAKEAKKALADKIAKAKTADEFKKIAVDVMIEDLDAKTSLAKYYTTEIEKLTLKDADAYKTMKDEDVTKAIDYIKEHIAEEPVAEEIVEEDNPTDETAYAAACAAARLSLHKDLHKEYITLPVEAVAYADPSADDTKDLKKWLFADGRALNDTTVISDEGDTTATYTAVIVTRTSGRDESLTKNAAHILFATGKNSKYESDDAAKAEAEKVLDLYNKGEKTLDAFKALGEEYTDDSNVLYENITEGQMVNEFNDWIFDGDRKEGDVEIVKTTYGYHIIYFAGDGEQFWYNSAKNDVINSELDDWFGNAQKKYDISLVQKTLDKISKQY